MSSIENKKYLENILDDYKSGKVTKSAALESLNNIVVEAMDLKEPFMQEENKELNKFIDLKEVDNG